MSRSGAGVEAGVGADAEAADGVSLDGAERSKSGLLLNDGPL